MTPHADSRRKGGPVAALNIWRDDSVWGEADGERKAVKLAPPVPSPLEIRAAAVNAAPHFRAFERAAHGKVRHSVRWKNRKNVKPLIVLALLSVLCKVLASKPVCSQSDYEEMYSLSLKYEKTKASEVARNRREKQKITSELNKNARIQSRLRKMYRDHPFDDDDLPFKNANDSDYTAVSILVGSVSASINDPELKERLKAFFDNESDAFRQVSAYILVLEDISLIKALLEIIKLSRLRFVDRRVIEVKLLWGAIFRARIPKRVRSVLRRTRVRRPLYARPRPPTAPLAPPVI